MSSLSRASDEALSLEEALSATERAEALGAADGILLNSRGNALGLLQRWGEARAAYAAATTLSPRDFESIPRSNEALALMQLEEPAPVEGYAERQRAARTREPCVGRLSILGVASPAGFHRLARRAGNVLEGVTWSLGVRLPLWRGMFLCE